MGREKNVDNSGIHLQPYRIQWRSIIFPRRQLIQSIFPLKWAMGMLESSRDSHRNRKNLRISQVTQDIISRSDARPSRIDTSALPGRPISDSASRWFELSIQAVIQASDKFHAEQILLHGYSSRSRNS